MIAFQIAVLAIFAAATGFATSADDAEWYNSLSRDEKKIYTTYYTTEWFADLSDEKQCAYAAVARDILELLDSDADSRADDNYQGFAPLLLRTSFHSAGTFHKPSGTGGSNGGTLRHEGELEDGENGCISIGMDEIANIVEGHDVSVADAIVIAGSISLDHMDFPRMELVKITGGRDDYTNVAYRDRLPSADDDPMAVFTEQLGFTNVELVALIGGAHNVGSSHGKCSGYNGQWSNQPLSWNGDDGNGGTGPDFFVNLMRDDWKWFELHTYQNDTITYMQVASPFEGEGEEEEEEEHGSSGLTQDQWASEEPIKVEVQAMRGSCEVIEGNYGLKDTPCDGEGELIIRLRADFWLRMNPAFEPHARAFAEDPELFAEEFGKAYHKLTHFGLNRCGMSGFGCDAKAGTFCEKSHTSDGVFLHAGCTATKRMRSCMGRSRSQ